MVDQRANGVHFVGSSVNIPDMSASLQAKVTGPRHETLHR